MRTSVEVFPVALFDTFEPFTWGIRHGCVVPHSVVLWQGVSRDGTQKRDAHLVTHISCEQLVVMQVGWKTIMSIAVEGISLRTYIVGRISR